MQNTRDDVGTIRFLFSAAMVVVVVVHIMRTHNGKIIA